MGEPDAKTTEAVLRGLGFGGMVCLMWTVIFCTVVFKSSESVLLQLWERLYYTWLALVVAWAAISLWVASKSKGTQPAAPEVHPEAKPEAPPPPGTK